MGKSNSVGISSYSYVNMSFVVNHIAGEKMKGVSKIFGEKFFESRN
jgi:hypothetical protein